MVLFIPRALPSPRPCFGNDHDMHPGAYLLKLLRKWDWKRPEIDPVLALGQIGAFVSVRRAGMATFNLYHW